VKTPTRVRLVGRRELLTASVGLVYAPTRGQGLAQTA